MKYRSKKASIANVKRFFSNTSDDSVSIQDAFIAWGRNLEKVQENMNWLSNKLTSIKYHNLINPVYDYASGHRKLDKLELTIEGKKALGRIGGDIGDNSHEMRNHGEITIEDIMRVLPKLKQKNPEFNIVFSVTPREDSADKAS